MVFEKLFQSPMSSTSKVAVIPRLKVVFLVAHIAKERKTSFSHARSRQKSKISVHVLLEPAYISLIFCAGRIRRAELHTRGADIS